MIPLELFSSGNKKRIAALGELLIDLIPSSNEGMLESPGTLIKTASGSSGIFACAVVNLGGQAGFLGKLGQDKLSKFVLNITKQQGVDVSRIKIVDEGQIGLAFIEYTTQGRNYQFYRNDSVGSLLTEDDIDEEYIKNSAAIHYPGMLLELNPLIRNACTKAVTIARNNNVIVSFDPNIRKELIKDDEAIKRLTMAVSQADIISPTLDEAKFITGEDNLIKILKKLHKMGPKVVAITKDEDGALLSCNGEIIDFSGIKVNTIDPTGAGDTFAAALMVGLLNGWNLEQIGIFSNCAGALSTTKQGAIGIALPSLKQVEEFMTSNKFKIQHFSKEVNECA